MGQGPLRAAGPPLRLVRSSAALVEDGGPAPAGRGLGPPCVTLGGRALFHPLRIPMGEGRGEGGFVTAPLSEFCSRRALPRVEPFDAHRHDRDQHDRHHHQLEVISDERNVAEVIAAQQKHADPHGSADAVELPEADVAHAGDPGDKRGERADDGDEPGDHDRLSAVPLVKLVCSRQVFLVEQPRVFVMKDFRAEHVADPIVDGVAGDRRHDQERNRKGDAQMRALARGQHAEREQERVARQNRRDHQACLTKDHDEHQQIEPRPERRRDRVEMLVEMQEEVDCLPDEDPFQFLGRRPDRS